MVPSNGFNSPPISYLPISRDSRCSIPRQGRLPFIQALSWHIYSITTPERIGELQQERSHVHVSSSIREYLSRLVQATRQHPSVRYGASPRATLSLQKASQAWALLQGRAYVIPDDVQELSGPLLLHRLILKPEERLRGISPREVLEEVVRSVPVPLPT